MIMFGTLDAIAKFPGYPEEPGAAPEELDDPMWNPRMDSVDTLILYRQTYIAWADFWPAKKNAAFSGE